jgi:hypothetical protein
MPEMTALIGALAAAVLTGIAWFLPVSYLRAFGRRMRLAYGASLIGFLGWFFGARAGLRRVDANLSMEPSLEPTTGTLIVVLLFAAYAVLLTPVAAVRSWHLEAKRHEVRA